MPAANGTPSHPILIIWYDEIEDRMPWRDSVAVDFLRIHSENPADAVLIGNMSE